MSFGKIYGYKPNARTMVLLALAEENGLDVEFVDTNPARGFSEEYKKLNPALRIPTFQAADGWVLTEVMAIAVYLTSQNKTTPLLGSTPRDYASILRWMSFVNSDVLETMIRWFRPFIGTDPFHPPTIATWKAKSLHLLSVLDAHFTTNRFFTGDQVSLADYFAASQLSRGFQFVLDEEWRQANPGMTRWFREVIGTELGRKVVPRPIFIERALTEPLGVEEQLAAQGRPRVVANGNGNTVSNGEERVTEMAAEGKTQGPGKVEAVVNGVGHA